MEADTTIFSCRNDKISNNEKKANRHGLLKWLTINNISKIFHLVGRTIVVSDQIKQWKLEEECSVLPEVFVFPADDDVVRHPRTATTTVRMVNGSMATIA